MNEKDVFVAVAAVGGVLGIVSGIILFAMRAVRATRSADHPELTSEVRIMRVFQVIACIGGILLFAGMLLSLWWDA